MLKHIGIFLLFGLDYLIEKVITWFGYIVGLLILFYIWTICK